MNADLTHHTKEPQRGVAHALASAINKGVLDRLFAEANVDVESAMWRNADTREVMLTLGDGRMLHFTVEWMEEPGRG